MAINLSKEWLNDHLTKTDSLSENGMFATRIDLCEEYKVRGSRMRKSNLILSHRTPKRRAR